MRKILASALMAGTLLTVGTASADARTVEGSILVPSVRDSESLVFAPPPGPVAKHARCAYLVAKDATGNGNDANGLVGWHIDLSEAEGDGAHTFTLTSDAGNIAVYFYEDLGTCDGNAGSTGQEVTDGDEAGTIPFFSSHAIVVVEDAADVNFAFTVNTPAA
jgi:hypothetical protein